MTSSFLQKAELISLLEQGIVNITFQKLDGVEKTIRATLIPEVLPEEAIQIHPDYVTLYSITDDGWRTVVPSRISNFTVEE